MDSRHGDGSVWKEECRCNIETCVLAWFVLCEMLDLASNRLNLVRRQVRSSGNARVGSAAMIALIQSVNCGFTLSDESHLASL